MVQLLSCRRGFGDGRLERYCVSDRSARPLTLRRKGRKKFIFIPCPLF